MIGDENLMNQRQVDPSCLNRPRTYDKLFRQGHKRATLLGSQRLTEDNDDREK
jgi:hypothetical protein